MCRVSRSEEGHFTGSTRRGHHRTHLLQEMVYCKCGEVLYVAGAHGQYLGCKGYLDGVCACRTRLPRKLAARMILAAISERILRSDSWVDVILRETLKTWRQWQQEQPDQIASLERRIADFQCRIGILLDQLEETGDSSIAERLGERRAEKTDCERQLAKLRKSASERPCEPTREWVLSKLQNLEAVLNGDPTPAAYALSDLVGKIVVEEIPRPGRKRKALRGLE